ncbi:hypothetical protein LMG29542_07262 [Paraburkholderia humisilvae]|uniref:Uncharacterized protein n=1 Tax=Paraburkholderia humisilvae TaxID=627669 RepID=A0A6J5F3S4_9BURK|nr:hypothetical protein LMG29542_07262 [Paraburkholderia humisilvae]
MRIELSARRWEAAFLSDAARAHSAAVHAASSSGARWLPQRTMLHREAIQVPTTPEWRGFGLEALTDHQIVMERARTRPLAQVDVDVTSARLARQGAQGGNRADRTGQAVREAVAAARRAYSVPAAVQQAADTATRRLPVAWQGAREAVRAALEANAEPSTALRAALVAGADPVAVVEAARERRIDEHVIMAVSRDAFATVLQALAAAVALGGSADDALRLARIEGVDPRAALCAVREAGAALGAALEMEASRAEDTDQRAALRAQAHLAEMDAEPHAVLRAALALGAKAGAVLSAALDIVQAVRVPQTLELGGAKLRGGGDPRPAGSVALDALAHPELRMTGLDTHERVLARLDGAEAAFQAEVSRVKAALAVTRQTLGRAGIGEQKARALEYNDELKGLEEALGDGDAHAIRAQARALEDRANDEALIRKLLTDADYETILRHLQAVVVMT